MRIGLIGKKCGMSRVFSEDGLSVPVTVLHIDANRVTQKRTIESDGYTAVQVTAGLRKRSRVNKSTQGHFTKAGVEPGILLNEFRVSPEELAKWNVGDSVPVTVFTVGQLIDVSGRTKGKGYAGTIKRWHFRGQDNSHGNSKSHRVPGSIGQNQDPGKVFKGKKMTGHLGNVMRTISRLEVVKVDEENNLILVKGSVPGAIGGDVFLKATAKETV